MDEFTIGERKSILEKIEQMLDKKKVYYKNEILFLNTKKLLVAFLFDKYLFIGKEKYFLSRITLYDNNLNIITGINKQKGYKDVWKKINQKLINKFLQEFEKHKILIKDVFDMLE